MKYTVLILTDNNRQKLEACMMPVWNTQAVQNGKHASLNTDIPEGRIIYMELYPSWEEAQGRLEAIRSFTRMQTERLVRRKNPNWVNLIRSAISSDYQPGVKLRPNVPKLTSLR